MAGNTLAGHALGAPFDSVADEEVVDPSVADVVRIVRAVEDTFDPARDRTSHVVLGKGAVFAMGVGLVLATGMVLNEFVHTVVDELARSL